MRAILSPTRGSAWILTAVMVATACHSAPRSEGLARQLREVRLTAERDSLLMEVAANGKFLTDIQGELARVTPKPRAGTPESPSLEITKDQRAFTLDRVRDITTRLKTADTRLAASEQRARRLSRSADSLAVQNEAARTSIADLTAIIGTQRETIGALTAQVDSLTTWNLVLADSVYHLTDDHNTAYYVVGTRAELLASGVIVEDGHRAIPLIGRRTVQPARRLPLQEFTSIDRTETRRIPLPHPERQYTIVSRQDLTQLAGGFGKGEVDGAIEIASPERFWEPSKYLIVVER
jgi:hypothetical protein